ncbi:MAG: UDP-N-acetylmuramate--L-alanine ligase [Ruminococcaceae bacterium]|nr:UDP-N-acetylmuramate--L-alanine ligase [Oscillospiraceae bacterium]
MALENTHYGHREISRMLAGCRSIFFIGIGGISMSALAQLSKNLGYTVGGSDRSENPQVKALREAGIPVHASHDAANVARYDAVVYTVAIGADNPEYIAAQKSGKPLLSRSDYLGYLMISYLHRIGVAGMHGKTTCTAMCAQIFLEAADPTVMCGAELPILGNDTCRISRSREHFVFEACEYMDSFLDFNPTLALILNIGLDHVDYFKSMEQIRTSFLRFAERTGENGCVLYNADDEECERALADFGGKKVTFSLGGHADFCARNITYGDGETSFDFCRGECRLARIKLHVFGRHNVYNALAAASAATLCGLDADRIASALASFTGARRRMEFRGRVGGASVYDDYAHHPDEIRATLSGAKEMGYKRVLCAYQPHTYSRTAGLFEDFAGAFGDADRVYFADIYAAREQNVYGVSSALLSEAVGERAQYCGSFSSVADAIRRDAREGDLVIVMGAGDIYKVFELLGV